MAGIPKTGSKGYPSIPSIDADLPSLVNAVQQIKESVETHERKNRNYQDSFVRYQELIDIGLLNDNGEYNPPSVDFTAVINDLSVLEARVDIVEGDITAQQTLTTQLETDLQTLDLYAQGNASAIQSLDTRVTINEAGLTTQSTAITQLDSDLQTLDLYAQGNATAIQSLDTRVTSNESDITAQSTAITQVEADVSSLDADVVSVTATASSNLSAIATLNGYAAASYGVTLDVNGFVTGFQVINQGAGASEFNILANKFAIVDPGAGGGAVPQEVFGISGGVVTMQNVVIDNAVITDLSVDKLTTGTLDAEVDLGTGLIVLDNGVYTKVLGNGFGTSNQFISWYGPSMATSAMDESNAISYETVSGDAYFSGTLLVGDITNTGKTTDTSATASITVGPFATNGNTISVASSMNSVKRSYRTTSQTPSAPTATVVLYQTISPGSETTVATYNITGSVAEIVIGAGNYEIRQILPLSQIFSDISGGTGDRTYRLALTARNFPAVGGTSTGQADSFTQTLSLVCSEAT